MIRYRSGGGLQGVGWVRKTNFHFGEIKGPSLSRVPGAGGCRDFAKFRFPGKARPPPNPSTYTYGLVKSANPRGANTRVRLRLLAAPLPIHPLPPLS